MIVVVAVCGLCEVREDIRVRIWLQGNVHPTMSTAIPSSYPLLFQGSNNSVSLSILTFEGDVGGC